MQAGVIPESPRTPETPSIRQTRDILVSPPETSPSLTSTFSDPSTPKGLFTAIPEYFPCGADLNLTREQLRLAFFFSPKDRCIVDPEEKYWGRGRQSNLRTEFWNFTFERNEDYHPRIDETP
ncbi:hypothetical protein N7533_004087 [Penicillium manginii]|uniref:uncharacterized protein n=1 Tax=Penicillium manginii TaxID=203109 RepID=UPI0025478F28|nr:uncharacterized protein N7533_004087 [Penicillium manginii]KAJ5754544.1 hypothetical protein N7533_004087 [Penicillium manginii]